MSEKDSAKEFYDRQRNIQQAIDMLPNAMDEMLANRLAVHEARIGERIDAMEKSALLMTVLAVVITASVVVLLFHMLG